MSKYYSPRDWDVIGFGNSRRYVRITDEELHKRFAAAEKKRNLKNKNKNKKKGEQHYDEY